MASDTLHETRESLSEETLELHRAISSLIEELEAVDWYGQRVDACGDDELRNILEHNRDEEKEHACMTLEWIRRRDAGFDEFLRRFLFQSGPIAGSHDDEIRTPPRAAGTLAAQEAGLEIGGLRGEAKS